MSNLFEIENDPHYQRNAIQREARRKQLIKETVLPLADGNEQLAHRITEAADAVFQAWVESGALVAKEHL